MTESYLLVLIEKHFSKLFDEYGFEIMEASSRMGDYWVFFKNETTIIRFYSSQFSGYSDLIITFANVNKSEKVGLFSNLLHLLEVESLPELGQRGRIFENLDAFETRVQEKSEQLFMHAIDLLQGDFTRLPELIKFQEKRSSKTR